MLSLFLLYENGFHLEQDGRFCICVFWSLNAKGLLLSVYPICLESCHDGISLCYSALRWLCFWNCWKLIYNIFPQVYYKFNSLSLLREPLMLIFGFFFFFVACIVYMHADLTISKSSASYMAKLQWDEVSLYCVPFCIILT